MKNSVNKYWFKRKRYGWGWTPVTKEGWFVTLLYLLLVISAVTCLDTDYTTLQMFVSVAVSFVLFTLCFLYIAWKTGEKPRWQWGDKFK